MWFLCVRHLPIYASHDAILPQFYVVAAVIIIFSSVQFSSVAQSCPTRCNPMECSMRSFSVHRQLMELVQIHVHQISDAIQPSHPLLSPFFSCLQSWPASESFPMVWFPYCPKDSQESSTPQFKSINSSAFSFLYSPTLHTLLICFLICI